jgi:MOSC domain-containing protein YiiM
VTGTLAGIARHARPRGPMEELATVHVTVEGGLDGDFRGVVKPGGRGRRQVSLIEAGDWAAAMADLDAGFRWSQRRANLLVDGFDLPQQEGARVRIGAVLLEITQECEPCSRMEEIAPGLKAALSLDWRGGALAKVIEGGTITIGETIVLEERHSGGMNGA